MSKHYIDKEQFYQDLKKWIETDEYQKVKAEGGKPRPPDNILVDYCYKIINKYIAQRKWHNVPEHILEEAVPLAFEFCIKYLHNFKLYREDKKTGKKVKGDPFSYTTQFVTNAILQSYNLDKKEKENRMAYLTTTLSSSTYIRTDGEIDLMAQGEFSQNHIKHLENMRKDYNNE